MRRALLVIALVAAFAAAVAAFAPATLAAAWIARASHDALALAGAEGTIWHGRGTLVAGAESRLPLAWSLDPWPLLRAEVRLSLASFEPAASLPRGEIALHDRVVALRGLDIVLPAEMLRQAMSGMAIRASGDVRVTATSLDWTPSSIRGAVDIGWHDARLSAGTGPAVDLGTLTAKLAGEGTGLVGPIANDGGDVDVRGSAAWRPGSGGEASLLLAPRRADDSATARLLAAIGAPEAGGFRVVLRTGMR